MKTYRYFHFSHFAQFFSECGICWTKLYRKSKHILCTMQFFSKNRAVYEIKSEKFGTTGQAIDDSTIQLMGIAGWISKTEDIIKIYNSYCCFTVPMVTRVRLKITLIRTLPLLFSLQSFCNLGREK